MSDDEDFLVEKDELNYDKMNSMLINVAPFDGLENVGFENDSRVANAKDAAAAAEDAPVSPDTVGEKDEFIAALFVVVFDTRHGKLICELPCKSSVSTKSQFNFWVWRL